MFLVGMPESHCLVIPYLIMKDVINPSPAFRFAWCSLYADYTHLTVSVIVSTRMLNEKNSYLSGLSWFESVLFGSLLAFWWINWQGIGFFKWLAIWKEKQQMVPMNYYALWRQSCRPIPQTLWVAS